MEDKISKILIYLFYLLALLAVVLYFACGEDKTPFFYSGGAALIARGIHYVMKYLL